MGQMTDDGQVGPKRYEGPWSLMGFQMVSASHIHLQEISHTRTRVDLRLVVDASVDPAVNGIAYGENAATLTCQHCSDMIVTSLWDYEPSLGNQPFGCNCYHVGMIWDATSFICICVHSEGGGWLH